MHPFSKPVPTWHSQSTAQNDFEIFGRWLCHKFQVLHRLQSTDTGSDVHVIMFTQCYDVSNTIRLSYGRKVYSLIHSILICETINSCIKTEI